MMDGCPDETIRAAAASMREKALKATGGGVPWFIADCDLYPRWILAETGDAAGTRYNDDVIRTTEEDYGMFVSDTDWDYIASAHPGVILALAEWMDSVAIGVGGIFQEANALKVARAWLRETA